MTDLFLLNQNQGMLAILQKAHGENIHTFHRHGININETNMHACKLLIHELIDLITMLSGERAT